MLSSRKRIHQDQKSIFFYRTLVGVVIFVLVSFFPFSILIIQASSCDVLEGDARDDCEDLEAKSKAYQNIIELKQRQGSTLSSQIDLLDAQVGKLETKINQNQRVIGDLTSQIDTLFGQIQEKETVVTEQKKVLTALLRSYYDDATQNENGESVIPVLFAPTGVINSFSRDDYHNEASGKTSEMLGDIQSLRASLVKNYDALRTKKKQAEDLHSELSGQSQELQDTKQNKSSLLAQTQADEKKYQSLLARVESQKQELFNFSEASNLAEVSDSVKDYPKPDKKNQASTDWYFSQKDSRWGTKTIGNSKSLMEDYGCAITAVSMVFRKYGSNIDPGKMAKQKIFYYDLIVWPKSWDQDNIRLISSTAHNNINWSTLDSELKKSTPVIVHINKKNRRGGHYVVITGKDSKDYIVHDPYFGPNLYLGTSRALVGKLGTDSGTTVDQMILYED